MLRLSKEIDGQLNYWETWEIDAVTHAVHWGVVGDKGDSRTLDFDSPEAAQETMQGFVTDQVGDGYAPRDLDDHDMVKVSYEIHGHGGVDDVDKRHELEARLNQTLGWKGLGHVDGGDIGSGAMAVFCLVVDGPTAKAVIEHDLADTKFVDYTSISL